MEKVKIVDLCKSAQIVPLEESYRIYKDSAYMMGISGDEKILMIFGENTENFIATQVKLQDTSCYICKTTRENSMILGKTFPFTVPVSLAGKAITIGTGDRLGLVSGAHIKAIRGTGAFPVLAQQSNRELTLTKRSNRSMMDDVMWQVFEVGYEDGYGADGDHLKLLEDVKAAVFDGDTMITLDCSDYIQNLPEDIDAKQAEEMYKNMFDKGLYEEWNQIYRGITINLGQGTTITFDDEELNKIYVIYGKMLAFVKKVYTEAIKPANRPISLEISIDETEVETSYCAHFFVANELIKLGVHFESMAPRFSGEFQKGIDYIGDLDQFEKEFAVHVKIAENLGYRISVHSGSDKFSVFPIVGKLSNKRFHLKTSGTSWVECIRVVAMCDPKLFREILKYSCTRYAEAKANYHVTGLVSNIPAFDEIDDKDLPDMLDQIDTRQVIHINYGFVLNEKDNNGNYIFKEGIYKALRANKETLDKQITKHIKRHLQDLQVL